MFQHCITRFKDPDNELSRLSFLFRLTKSNYPNKYKASTPKTKSLIRGSMLVERWPRWTRASNRSDTLKSLWTPKKSIVESGSTRGASVAAAFGGDGAVSDDVSPARGVIEVRISLVA